ncbi:hypothetical protein SAMN04488557_2229 [Hyphomicrobium facile]|uniref:Uncharacterized protein n=1 Tax=Hyphomicrobium facile TaxID=51670 RepID=A0A1I7NHI1_9HYPH|nr:hypothetical protein SAMN04488557_2229 [Hyphomicrobium facile]
MIGGSFATAQTVYGRIVRVSGAPQHSSAAAPRVLALRQTPCFSKRRSIAVAGALATAQEFRQRNHRAKISEAPRQLPGSFGLNARGSEPVLRRPPVNSLGRPAGFETTKHLSLNYSEPTLRNDYGSVD